MSYAPETSPRPPMRPDDLVTNHNDDSDSDHNNDWSTMGTPELYQPKVVEALKESPSDDESEPVQTVFEDILYGSSDPIDPQVDALPLDERVDLAFDQRIEAGVASTIIGMGAADAVGAVKSMVPGPLKLPAQVAFGTTVSRATFPPMKEAADWYHGEVLEQPIVDPSPGIFSEENLADFVPGVVSTAAGMGAHALSTTALTALGVSNPVTLTIIGLGTGAYAAGKAWVYTDEVLIPAAEDYVFESITSSIDVEGLTGIPESAELQPGDGVTLAELEALWDSVADQIPAAEAEALGPSVGVLAPDHWTIGDIARYEADGTMPEVDPELAEFLERNNLDPRGLEPVDPVEIAVGPTVDELQPEVPVFRTTRVEPEPEVPVESVVVVEPFPEEPIDVFVFSNEDDDGPDPQCLVPYWLIPYVDELTALGVRDFCALQHLTPDDIEDLLDELSGIPEEPVLIDEGPVITEVCFVSSRGEKEHTEEGDTTDEFLLF